MYLSELLRSLGRRWYIVVVGLLATVGLSYTATTAVPAEYVATSSMLLLPPANTVGAGGNPYLALGGLQAAADVLSRALTDQAISERIAPISGTATYIVQSDHTTSGPIMYIEVTDHSADGAVSTLGKIIDEAPGILKQLQTDVGAPTASFMSVETITRDTIPTPDTKSQMRAVILVAVVGLVGTIFGTSLINSLLVRRAASRQARRADRRTATRGASAERAALARARPATSSRSLEPSARSTESAE